MAKQLCKTNLTYNSSTQITAFDYHTFMGMYETMKQNEEVQDYTNVNICIVGVNNLDHSAQKNLIIKRALEV